MQEAGTIEIQGSNPICISFASQVDPKTAPALLAVAGNAVNAGHDEIHLLLSTPGGNVGEGIAVYNFLKALPVPVVTYNTGKVDSIGNVIYQAGTRRLCATTSSFMFHGVGFAVEKAHFEMKQVRERLEMIKNDQAMISDIMVRHTDLSADDVENLFLEMAFLSAQEALNRRITDEIRDIRLPNGLPVQQLVFQG
ncbi:ATP-dependent Clp protease proteolytic subunit [Roseovarius sp. EGI FJ00037]|uniref:ATP-dependent Clp protease proteolytic subunit n=1 Tax=Roseovarius salincola TaxID=2978479 RepID=UPI0022A89700|nr:ATP-dependent Clp protease proteolytic subunit [Roseovarius sp. EGI FJ00037]MCZ0814385.1 ATP-dependent Clp protease proteolytic subunit [Roseovarius sp. EGI FJ00037]